MLSPKLLLISVAVIFTALGVKAALPLATTHLSLIWTFFLLCFTPPYLYFTLNAIIISILASSRFHNSSSSSFTAQPNLPIHPNYPPPPPPPVLEMNTINFNDAASMTKEEQEQEEEIKEIDLGMELIKRMDSLEIPPEYLPEMEKPLVSGRFHNQHHRKPLKSSLEAAGGKALRSPKPKRNETLENTWKAITEGRSIPLSSRHMKKCDTWHNRCETDPPEPEVMSSNDDEGDRFNFNLAVTSATATAAKMRRKEPSLSQDELNRRVEEFIHNFNHQMRLQRQRSLDQYLQITNGRGAN